MKYDEHTEQLLNGFIDGQLTAREQTELKRLMRNDAGLEKKIAQLQKCRALLASLPVEKAPEGLIEQLFVAREAQKEKTAVSTEREKRVEAGAAQVEPAPAQAVRTGARQLMLRKMLSAAAIILLAAGLLVIVWMVVSPGKQVPKPTAVVKKPVETPVTEPKVTAKEQVPEPLQTETKAAEATAAAVDNKPTIAAEKKPEPETTVAAVTVFSATIQLKANKVLAADVALKKVLEQTVASDFVQLPSPSAKGSLTGDDRYEYSLECDVAKMNSFLTAAEAIWEQFSDAKLLVPAGSDEQGVVIDSVRPWQIADLSAISDSERLIKAAHYYAILNNSQKILQQNEQVFAQDQQDVLQLLNKPKPMPVLTKDERPVKKQPAGRYKAHLTIELSAEQQ